MTTQPMYRRPALNGDEQDAFSRSARRVLCSLQRAGVVHATKARAARRDRRQARQTLRHASHLHDALVLGLATSRIDVNRPADYAHLIDLYDRMELAAL